MASEGSKACRLVEMTAGLQQVTNGEKTTGSH